MIFVDDGSTDNTKNIALKYGEKLKDRGFEFHYIWQANAGQAAAINTGLKVFTGDYLTWPDSDDYLSTDSIEKKVHFLEQNREYGFVRSDAYLLNESKNLVSEGYISKKKDNRFNEYIFDDLILETTFCSNGCYMVRSKAFFDVNHYKEIFISPAGQNWQMLLPLAFSHKCGYIDEPLYNICVRQNSHSRILKGKKERLMRAEEHEEIIRAVIKDLDLDMDYYDQLLNQKYNRKKLMIAGRYLDKKLAKQYYSLLKEKGYANNEDLVCFVMSRNIFFNLFIRISLRGFRSLKNMIARKRNVKK